MQQRFFQLVLSFLVVSSAVFAAAVPGGLVRSAEGFSQNTYELMLSPAYALADSKGGMYLSSELRMQPSQDIGAGFGFGAGELGFNFGAYATWYVLPDTSSQPAFSILGGLYFNKVIQQNFFVVKVAPTVSKTFKTGWGGVTPYAGLPLAPSFGLGNAQNEFTMKASVGSEFLFRDLQGLRFWMEFGVGLIHSNHEVALAVAYPFSAFGG